MSLNESRDKVSREGEMFCILGLCKLNEHAQGRFKGHVIPAATGGGGITNNAARTLLVKQVLTFQLKLSSCEISNICMYVYLRF